METTRYTFLNMQFNFEFNFLKGISDYFNYILL